MALSVCNTITDLHDQELKKHGDPSFPIACYADDLSLTEVPWHWHEEWELIIVTEGLLHLDLAHTHVELSLGDGVFINSKVMHAVYPTPSSVGKLHSIVFHPRLIGGAPDSTYWQGLVQPFFTHTATPYLLLNKTTAWHQEVLLALQAAWAAIAEEQDDYENLARYQLSKAMRKIVQNTDFTQTALSEKELLKISRIRTMMEYIDRHFMEDLTVESIAKCISVSKSVCLRCFHEMLHTTPMQYVTETRLRKAAALLRTTKRTAKDIALDCGFSDISYFTKVFRENYGCTPMSYRKIA